MSALLDAFLRASLSHFRAPIHALVDEGYDAVQAAALAAVDGLPNTDGALNPFEREMSADERLALSQFILVFRSRLHREVDRLLGTVPVSPPGE